MSSEVVDGWKYVQLGIDFDDVRALKKTKIFEDSELSITRNDDGSYTLLQKSAGGRDASAGDASMQQQVAAMFAGLRIASAVVVPGEIIETNATSVDGNRAAWVFDIEQDPDVIAKLQNTDLRLVFSCDEVALPGLAH